MIKFILATRLLLRNEVLFIRPTWSLPGFGPTSSRALKQARRAVFPKYLDRF